MDNLIKRTAVVCLAVLLLICVFTPSVTAFADGTVYRAYRNDTVIYAAANENSAKVGTVGVGDDVVVLGEEAGFYRAEFAQIIGYIKKTDLYVYRVQTVYELKKAKVTVLKSGDKVNLYESPSAESNIVATVNDGKVLELLYRENDDFYRITHDGKIVYIAAENVTAGLSYYQRLALIIGLIAFVTVGLTVLLVYYGKNHAAKKTAEKR